MIIMLSNQYVMNYNRRFKQNNFLFDLPTSNKTTFMYLDFLLSWNNF